MPVQREYKQGALNITHCVSLRYFGAYENTNDIWTKLTHFAFQHGIAGPDVVAFGVCYDDPSTTPADQIRYDACLSISKKQFDDLSQRLLTAAPDEVAGIRLEEINVGKTVMTVHRGHYKAIRNAYTDMLHASAFRGLSVQHKPPFIEVYRNNPALTKAENLITEVHFRSP